MSNKYLDLDGVKYLCQKILSASSASNAFESLNINISISGGEVSELFLKIIITIDNTPFEYSYDNKPLIIKIPAGAKYKIQLPSYEYYYVPQDYNEYTAYEGFSRTINYEYKWAGVGVHFVNDKLQLIEKNDSIHAFGICSLINDTDNIVIPMMEEPLHGVFWDSNSTYGTNIDGVYTVKNRIIYDYTAEADKDLAWRNVVIPSAIADMNGKSNTEVFYNHANKLKYNVILGCKHFKSDTHPEYDWWLPSWGELFSLYANYNDIYNLITGSSWDGCIFSYLFNEDLYKNNDIISGVTKYLYSSTQYECYQSKYSSGTNQAGFYIGGYFTYYVGETESFRTDYAEQWAPWGRSGGTNRNFDMFYIPITHYNVTKSIPNA